MSDKAFEDHLGQLFETPASRTAEPRLTAQVMHALRREQTRRSGALALGGLVGFALTITALLLSGGVPGVEHVGETALSVVPIQPLILSAAVVAVAALAALTQRLLREA